ncbi:MAG: ATP-binding protein [Lentisphaeria bacterium]|nr:ATP-binding protein [Lentisphaeria bacterium]
MLNFVSIKNFRSIVELALPLNYGEAKAPNGHQEWTTMPFLELNGSRAVPLLGLFGANASGKSNVIQAIGILKKLLVGGHSPSLYMPNRLHNGPERTVLEVQGTLRDIGVFRYSVGYDATEILTERLETNGKVVFLQDENELSLDGLQKRFYERERLLDIYKVECLNQDGRHKGCILSRIAQNYAGLNATASAVHKALTSHLEVYENNAFSGRDGLRMLIDSLGSGADVHTAFAEIDVMLRKLDLGILRMEYHPELGKDVPDIAEAIRTFHKDESGGEVQFSLVDESMGTRAAFGLLGVCLAALHSGKMLVIDEIDSSLHSLLVAEIIRLFKEKRYNTANAQLVFSAHNTDLLDRDLLRVSEVGIVNKNLKHGSALKRLCDFEGVRNVTNFRRQYLEGRFSGIPFPYL